MPNYFYIDANGQKQGPIDDQQLQMLAAQGMITPETVLETDTGHKGLAGQVLGLKFNAAASTSTSTFDVVTSDVPSPFAQLAQMVPTPESNRTLFTASWIGMAGGLLLSMIGMGSFNNGNDDFAGFLFIIGILGLLAGIAMFFVFGFKRCVLGLQRWAATPVSVEKLDGYFKGYWVCVLIEGTLFLLCSGIFGYVI